MPGDPPPFKAGEVDEWRNWLLNYSEQMRDERRKTARAIIHHEVIAHGVTVMRDEIVRLQAERGALRARVAELERTLAAMREEAS